MVATQYLILLIKHTPDMYLSELQHRLEVSWGVSVHESTICWSLHHAGYSMKKPSISALEWNKDIHCKYLLTVGLEFSAEQLVFVDESACNQITTHHQCAWSPVGHCAWRHDYFICGKQWVPPVLTMHLTHFFQGILYSQQCHLMGFCISQSKTNPTLLLNSIVSLKRSSAI